MHAVGIVWADTHRMDANVAFYLELFHEHIVVGYSARCPY